MSEEIPQSLVVMPVSGLVAGESSPDVLVEMVKDVLALSSAKALAKSSVIGGIEWREPDHSQILHWAKTLNITPEGVLENLQVEELQDNDMFRFLRFINKRSEFKDGRFLELRWDFARLPMALKDFNLLPGMSVKVVRFYYAVPENDVFRVNLFEKVEHSYYGAEQEVIELASDQITELEYSYVSGVDLRRLPSLIELDCSSTRPTSLDLSCNHKLKKLRCSFNCLAGLDLTGCPVLKDLDCSSNEFEHLNLEAVPLLERLNCQYNRLKKLDLSKTPLIRDLSCGRNEIDHLNLELIPLLEKLDCHNNKLNKLDISKVQLLEELKCGWNEIGHLNLEMVPRLKKLYCYHSSLRTLDLSKTPLIQELWCGGNKIDHLNLNIVPLLENLNCNDNRLMELDLSMSPLLQKLDCSQNLLVELDIRPLRLLKELKYDSSKVRLIKRSDQNF